MKKRVIYLTLVLFVSSLAFLSLQGCNSKNETNAQVVNTNSKVLGKRYVVCNDLEQAKKVINDEKDNVLLMTFTDAKDEESFSMQDKIYLTVEEELQKKNINVALALVRYTKEQEMAKKFMIRRVPHTVVIRKGIPVSSAFGILAHKDIMQIVEMSMLGDE